MKHENHTPTGAFKVRGGLVYLQRLREAEPACPGVVSATRGNHGQSLGLAARAHRLPTVIVVPHGNSREKNAAMRALGVDLIEHGNDFQESREAAMRIGAERGLHPVPPFHPWLMAGVASYGLELLESAPDLDTVYVPIGMGSGACAMITARDALGHRARIVGVVSAQAPAYLQSLAAGRIVEHPVTTAIADGLACRSPDPAALGILARGLDRIVAVDDGAIRAAMQAIFTDTHQVAEGAGAAGLAAALQERARIAGQRVGLVITGANVDAPVFADVLNGH